MKVDYIFLIYAPDRSCGPTVVSLQLFLNFLKPSLQNWTQSSSEIVAVLGEVHDVCFNVLFFLRRQGLGFCLSGFCNDIAVPASSGYSFTFICK